LPPDCQKRRQIAGKGLRKKKGNIEQSQRGDRSIPKQRLREGGGRLEQFVYPLTNEKGKEKNREKTKNRMAKVWAFTTQSFRKTSTPQKKEKN